MAAIHLFISSRDEIEDFCSMDKKTGRRYALCFQHHTLSRILSRQVPHTHNVICEDILMTCAVNSIFDCTGVLRCTPSNQIIEVCKQVAK